MSFKLVFSEAAVAFCILLYILDFTFCVVCFTYFVFCVFRFVFNRTLLSGRRGSGCNGIL